MKPYLMLLVLCTSLARTLGAEAFFNPFHLTWILRPQLLNNVTMIHTNGHYAWWVSEEEYPRLAQGEKVLRTIRTKQEKEYWLRWFRSEDQSTAEKTVKTFVSSQIPGFDYFKILVESLSSGPNVQGVRSEMGVLLAVGGQFIATERLFTLNNQEVFERAIYYQVKVGDEIRRVLVSRSTLPLLTPPPPPLPPRFYQPFIITN